MFRSSVMSFTLVVLLSPAWASEPGEPLDCDDWVFLEPGLSCTDMDCAGNRWCELGNQTQALSDGGIVQLRMSSFGSQIDCAVVGNPLRLGQRLEIVRFDGAVETIIGQLDARCGPPDTRDGLLFGDHLREVITFDPTAGRLYIHELMSTCTTNGSGACDYGQGPVGFPRFRGRFSYAA